MTKVWRQKRLTLFSAKKNKKGHCQSIYLSVNWMKATAQWVTLAYRPPWPYSVTDLMHNEIMMLIRLQFITEGSYPYSVLWILPNVCLMYFKTGILIWFVNLLIYLQHKGGPTCKKHLNSLELHHVKLVWGEEMEGRVRGIWDLWSFKHISALSGSRNLTYYG